MVTINLLNNKLLKSKWCERLIAENRGGVLQCMDFGKKSMLSFFSKTQFHFRGKILQQKNQHFSTEFSSAYKYVTKTKIILVCFMQDFLTANFSFSNTFE